MQDTRLAAKVALVTGGGRGIGRAIASRLAAAGARVAVCGRSPGPLDETVRAITAAGAVAAAYRLDVRDRRDVDLTVARAAAELSDAGAARLDLLVNNAGVSGQTPIDDPDDARWHDILATNLTGAMYVTRAALRAMPRGGRVVNVSSVLGKFGEARNGAYCAAKHGLIGLTRTLALELASRGITVNAICPGWVGTAMATRQIEELAAREGRDAARMRRELEEKVPLGRFVTEDEVADLALYLCLPGAAAITAQALTVDGGETPF